MKIMRCDCVDILDKLQLQIYRGQTLNGTWVYGHLTIIPKKVCSYDEGCYISNGSGMPFAYIVRPDTVDRFTEIYDRDGNEIYENDKIIVNDCCRTVIFKDGAFGYRIDKHNDFVTFANNKYLNILDGVCEKIYVVGNIY